MRLSQISTNFQEGRFVANVSFDMLPCVVFLVLPAGILLLVGQMVGLSIFSINRSGEGNRLTNSNFCGLIFLLASAFSQNWNLEISVRDNIS